MLQKLCNAARGLPNDLPQVPDPTPTFPYINLFSLVVLNPTSVVGLCIPTLYLPRVYSIQNGLFRPARTRSPTSALIFDVAAIGNDTTVSYGLIPLSPEQPEFNTQQYWRLPIDPEIVLAMLIEHILLLSPQELPQTGEIDLARSIFTLLLVQGGAVQGGDGGGHGGGGNIGNAVAGPSKPLERGEPAQKKSRTKKLDALNEDQSCKQLWIWIQPSVMISIVVSSCERPHYGVNPKEWVVATPSSMLPDGEPQAKVYSGYTPSNRESDCGEG